MTRVSSIVTCWPTTGSCAPSAAGTGCAGLARPFAPFAAHGSVMPLLASILAVCLVAGAMLSVATFSPATTPADRKASPATSSIPGVSLGPKSTTAAPVRPFVTSASAARASHSARPSASSSKTRPAVGTPLPSSPGAPR